MKEDVITEEISYDVEAMDHFKILKPSDTNDDLGKKTGKPKTIVLSHLMFQIQEE